MSVLTLHPGEIVYPLCGHEKRDRENTLQLQTYWARKAEHIIHKTANKSEKLQETKIKEQRETKERDKNRKNEHEAE